MRTLILAMGFAAVAAVPAYAQTGSTGAATGASLSTSTSSSTNFANVTRSTAGANATSATPPVSTGQSSVASGNRVTGDNVTNDPNAGTPPSSFEPGGAFSSGTGAGTGAGVVTTVPDNISVIGTGGGTTTRFVAPAASQPAPTATLSNTPLFDQAAREGRAKEERRRARGEEPRVYGIAPNTERDLTWQMPDDRVIRY